MKKGYVVYNEEFGVFIGMCFGLGFWSKLDPVDQPGAVAFSTIDDAVEFTKQVKSIFEFEIREVEDDQGGYASIESCVRAGLPGWEIKSYA